MDKYFVIIYKFSKWHMTHPNGMSLDDAKGLATKSEGSDVIHEMWLGCLAEWPEPGYFSK